MSEGGYRPDLANLEDVVKLKDTQPQTIGDVRKLLGLLGYYRRYIPNFARMAKPLFDLTKRSQESQRKKPVKKTKYQASSKRAIEWNTAHQKSLEILISHLIQPPILAYPDYSQSFVLRTDVSIEGLGAVLYQI